MKTEGNSEKTQNPINKNHTIPLSALYPTSWQNDLNWGSFSLGFGYFSDLLKLERGRKPLNTPRSVNGIWFYIVKVGKER